MARKGTTVIAYDKPLTIIRKSTFTTRSFLSYPRTLKSFHENIISLYLWFFMTEVIFFFNNKVLKTDK